jgi:hypothetical protein
MLYGRESRFYIKYLFVAIDNLPVDSACRHQFKEKMLQTRDLSSGAFCGVTSEVQNCDLARRLISPIMFLLSFGSAPSYSLTKHDEPVFTRSSKDRFSRLHISTNHPILAPTFN